MNSNRFISVAFRGSAIGSIFVFGLLYSFYDSVDNSSLFFISLAAVSLLIFILGLELHVYSDRAVARGMSSAKALKNTFLAQLPLAIAMLIFILPVCEWFGWETLLVLLIALNALIGLFVQEYFRIFIALGQQKLANLLIVIRTTAPFLVAIIALYFHKQLNPKYVLLLWLIGGVVAGIFAINKLRKLKHEYVSNTYQVFEALKTAGVFLPLALISRVLLSADLFVIGLVGKPIDVTIYGNLSSIASALLTIADLAIFQWRFKDVMKTNPNDVLNKRYQIETLIMGISSFLVALLLSAVLLSGLLGPGNVSFSSYVLSALLSVSILFAILTQGKQLSLYSHNRDLIIFRGYIAAFIVFMAMTTLTFVTSNVAWVVSGRAIAFAFLFLYFRKQIKEEPWKTIV